MKNLMMTFAVAAISMIGCGDDLKVPDAAVHRDAAPDAYCSDCPAPPTLGAQVDRLGRPAVNTVLNHGFDGNATAAGTAKDAYNQDSTPSGWVAANTIQFAANLAVVDALDVGLACTAGACTQTIGHCSITTLNPCGVDADCVTPQTCVGAPTPGDKCGNEVLYNGMPAGQIGSPMLTSYQTLAGILADDQLYLDTTKAICDIPTTHQNYLAVEFKVVTTIANSTCGGRAPTNDVIDTSYSALAIGLNGFATDGAFTPAFTDNVGPHTDVSNDVFPFLGAPH